MAGHCDRPRLRPQSTLPGTRIARLERVDGPLQITFRGMPPSDAVEAEIRSWVDKLEEFSGRIISCRVLVEVPHRRRHQGHLYRVRVDVGVPGEHIVVGRSPDQHHAHEDAHVAIRDAFNATRRRLEDYARRMRGQIKRREGPPHGHVVALERNLEFGRIETEDGREIYFHRNSVVGGIERLQLGDEVRFHEEVGDEGPQASSVDPLGAHAHHVL